MAHIGAAQCVLEGKAEATPESVVIARGRVAANDKAPGGYEVQVRDLEVVARAVPGLPVPVNQDPEKLSPEAVLDHRMISLRNPKILSTFKVQASILEHFAAHLRGEGFTEIKTCKLIGAGTEDHHRQPPHQRVQDAAGLRGDVRAEAGGPRRLPVDLRVRLPAARRFRHRPGAADPEGAGPGQREGSLPVPQGPAPRAAVAGLLGIYLTPVADLDDRYGKHPIADLIDNPMFPNPYSIEILLTGIRAEGFDALQKTMLNDPIEFLELALGQRSELNPVLHRLF